MLFLFEEIFCQKRQQLLQRWFDLIVIEICESPYGTKHVCTVLRNSHFKCCSNKL